MITTSEATVTSTQAKRARIWDGSARHLTAAHLRTFLRQFDLLGLPDDTEVRLSYDLHSGNAYHTVEITAGTSTSTSSPIEVSSE